MSSRDVLLNAVNPALEQLPKRMTSDPARVMLLAIGLQESKLTYRYQHASGPARGLWQFERVGVIGVLSFRTTNEHARSLCKLHDVRPVSYAVHEALAGNDVLAAGFARLLLWTDPRALPAAADAAWDYYLRNWRPGKPHPQTWLANYEQAVGVVRSWRSAQEDV